MWYIGFTISVIISLFLTHLVNILLAVILNKSVSKNLDLSKFKEHLFDFIYVTNLMLNKYSLLTIFVIFVAILIGVCYLLQGLIFDEKGYSEAYDVGIHCTSNWGILETLRDGKVLAKD